MTDQEIIGYIRANPYCTSAEIDRHANLGRYSLGGKIKDLAIDGYIMETREHPNDHKRYWVPKIKARDLFSSLWMPGKLVL